MEQAVLSVTRKAKDFCLGERLYAVFSLLVAMALLTSPARPAFGQGAITLTVNSGPAEGEVTLTWTGVQGPYSVFASNTADDVTDPSRLLGQTTSLSWVDTSPAEPIAFYRIRSDCDPAVDADGDGWTQCDDCADGDGSLFPGAPEACNAVDDDCDLLVDEDFDVDGDGFSPCPGNVRIFDCDDGNPDVNPVALETCGATAGGNGVDDDCDGYVDETCLPCDAMDVDADGVAECDGDCAPDDGNVFPGAEEVCDGLDTDCNLWTVENCGAGEPCDFPGDPDICRSDLFCTCVLDEAGSCSGSYVCSGFCNHSETGALGDGCAADASCLTDLLYAANLHVCQPTDATLGGLAGGEPCGSNAECRSGACNRLCAGGPSCIQMYCRDSCASDTYCQAPGTVCRLVRSENINGRCWPATPSEFIGAGLIGQACSGDADCDHGFCASAGNDQLCSAPCCGDSDCPNGFSCSLRGDLIDVGLLYRPPNAVACGTDPDCPTGMTCVENECAWRLAETSPMCLPDVAGQGDFPSGSTCTQNADCRSNFCEVESGICIENCCTDADCATGQVCRLQYVQTTVDRVTQARVCVTSPGEKVLRHD